MSSPFPGMDPYLEHPDLWPEVHHGLISTVALALAPQVRPKYRVAIEKRVYRMRLDGDTFLGRPDLVGGVVRPRGIRPDSGLSP